MLPSIERAQTEDEFDYQQTLHRLSEAEQDSQFDEDYSGTYNEFDAAADVVAATVGWGWRGGMVFYILAFFAALAVWLGSIAWQHIHTTEEVMQQQRSGQIVQSAPRNPNPQAH